jgi:hypothetical protein
LVAPEASDQGTCVAVDRSICSIIRSSGNDPLKSWEHARASSLRLLRSGEQTRIYELQPFNAWEFSIWQRPRGLVWVPTAGAEIPQQLQILDALDIVDKHRRVVPAWHGAAWLDALSLEKPIPSSGGNITADRLEDGAEIGRWNYSEPRPELPTDMDMNRYFPITVTLGNFPVANSAVRALEGLLRTVEIVVGLFRPCILDGLPADPISAIPL